MTLDFQRWSAVRALEPYRLVSLMTDQPKFLDLQSVQRGNDPRLFSGKRGLEGRSINYSSHLNLFICQQDIHGGGFLGVGGTSHAAVEL